MQLCLNLHELVLTQFLEANDSIKSVYMNVPANRAKEKVVKRDLFQSMKPNNRIQ